MASEELNPRSTIDRDAEQELFNNLVDGLGNMNSSARMLVISDKIGRGKTTCLKRFRYNCTHQFKPAIPVCLIDLKEISEVSYKFAFVGKIVEALSIIDKFPKFNHLNQARAAKNFDPFVTSNTGKGLNTGGDARAGIIVEHDNNVYGDQVNGDKVIGNKIVHNYIMRGDFTPDQETIAREKCIEAFFDDLHKLCDEQRTVILLDHWEGCIYDLQEWIRNTFMGEHCLNPDKNLRPAQLALVIAGNSFDNAKERFGIREGEFKDLFKNENEYDETVKSRASLSEWEEVHLKEFFELNGCMNVLPAEINDLHGFLKRGHPISRVLEGYKLFHPDR